MLYLYRFLRFSLFGVFALFASAVFAADVAPLYFSSVGTGPEDNAETQQEYWNTLMKYKIYGQHGIDFVGGEINIPDSSGWFGTSKGNFDMSKGNTQHVVGGPILIGGNIILSNGKDTLSTGPVRVLGDVTMGYSAWPEGLVRGDQCITGTVNPQYSNAVKDGDVYADGDYDNCPKKVYQLNEDLAIPAFSYDADYVNSHTISDISIDNNIHFIDVPKGKSSSDVYDIFIDRITMSNVSVLCFRMPYGGRLTRVFVKDAMTWSAHPKIRVVYMDSTATYDAASSSWNAGYTFVATEKDGDGVEHLGVWTVEKGTPVANIDYGGNLLFYIANDFAVPAIKALDSIQGTFISTGEISVQQHMTLAGQLIADKITINAQFDGSGFRYVPFDPPVLDPTLFTATEFKESDVDTIIPVKLDKNTEVNVYFSFCFEMSSKEPVDGMTADGLVDPSDFNDLKYICGRDTGRVVIPAGKDSPTDETQIHINPKLDPYIEVYGDSPKETLRLNVFDLQGAVLANNTRAGHFDLSIIDVNVVPVTRDTLFVVVEDTPTSFTKDNFPYASKISTEFAGVQIHTLPTTGSLTYKGKTVAVDQIIPVDSLGDLIFASVGEDYGDDYTSFEFAVVDANGGNSAEDKKQGYKVVTVDVTPVNDAPESRNTTFAVKARNESADTLKGSIKVTDVDDDEFLFVLDSSDANFKIIDSLFTFDASSGTMTIRDGIVLECGPDGIEYPIKVTISDKGASTNGKDIKSTEITLTVAILYDNNAPTLDPSKPSVSENTKPGVVVDTLKGTDKDKRDSVLTFELVVENPYFNVSESGVITVKDGAKLDYEKEKSVTIKVRVCDLYECDTSDVTISITDVDFKIVEVDETKYPNDCWSRLDATSCAPLRDTVFTNKPDVSIYCSLNNAKEELCSDTTLTNGCHHIVQSTAESDFLYGGELSDSIWICVSTQTPLVSMTMSTDKQVAGNVYTIVEEAENLGTDKFVNKIENVLDITVRDSVTGVDTSYSIKVTLDVVKVPEDTYKKVNAVVESGIKLDEDVASAITTPTNEGSRVTYTTTGKDGVEITVTYDKKDNGDVIETTVINEDGKEEKRELITVSYTTKVDGKEVVISYQADAATGLPVYKTPNGKLSFNDKDAEEGGLFSVAIPQKDPYAQVSYAVDKDGNLVKNESGDVGYTLTYTYVNKPYGNVATRSMFVILDQVGPKVEILTPADGITVSANFVDVVWTVNGEKQDTLNVQGLEKGVNAIVRFYKDKAGNMASDTVFVVMKDGKDVDVAVERPVTKVTQDKVDEYYASNPPEKGQTFAISIRNPKTGNEVETLKGGSFGDKPGSGKEPYPGVSSSKHLGPTLTMDIKLPVVNAVGGLATLDDLVGSDGQVSLDGVDAANSKKVSVEEYVSTYCDAGVKTTDISKVNLYNAKMDVKVWIYTTLGNFVDYYRFSQEMNNPDYTDDAGMLKMFFEQKPDKHGNVRDENGRLYATGAYLYKVEAEIRSELRCTLPPVDDESGKKKGDVIKSDDTLLKPFGYRRPEMR